MCERMIEPNEWDYDDNEAYEHDMNMYVHDLLYGEEEDAWYRHQADEYEFGWFYNDGGEEEQS